MYLHNRDLYYEIVVSKAQGKLTSTAKIMIKMLADRTIKKMKYWSIDDRNDCLQTGLLDLYSNWHNFNEEKTDNVFAYFTEIFKRALAREFNSIYKKKGDPDHKVKLISIESSNDGQGLHSI